MLNLSKHLSTVQNLGLNDRIIRGLIAALMIGLPPLNLVNGGLFDWHGYVMLLGIYPAITAILGYDPFYVLFNVRSCGNTQRNQCGTFPFEVDAALGHNPIVHKDYEFDHSLSPDYQQGALRGNAMTLKTQSRLLTLASVILTIAVIAYLSFLIR
jgi:hypothetical protein